MFPRRETKEVVSYCLSELRLDSVLVVVLFPVVNGQTYLRGIEEVQPQVQGYRLGESLALL